MLLYLRVMEAIFKGIKSNIQGKKQYLMVTGPQIKFKSYRFQDEDKYFEIRSVFSSNMGDSWLIRANNKARNNC